MLSKVSVCVRYAGHSKEVVQLGSADGVPTLLASLARDGELRTWDVACGACTSASASQATSLVRLVILKSRNSSAGLQAYCSVDVSAMSIE